MDIYNFNKHLEKIGSFKPSNDLTKEENDKLSKIVIFIINVTTSTHRRKKFEEWIYKLDENKQPIPVTKTRVLWNDPEDATSKNRLTYFWYIFLAICSIFMQIGPFTMFCFSTRSLFTALFLPFCLKAFVVDNGSADKEEKQPSEYTKGTAIIDILKYKLNIVMYIISYFVVKDAGLSLE